MRGLGIKLLALGPWLVASCSEAPVPSADGRNELLDLRRVTPIATPPETRLVERLTVPGDVAPWEVRPSAHRAIARVQEGGLALQVLGHGVTGVIVPGPHDPRKFNQLVVRGVFPGAFSLQVLFRGRREDSGEVEALVDGGTQKVYGRLGEEDAVLFDFQQIRRYGQPFDELALVVRGPRPGFEIRSIDLLDLPFGLCLPTPEGGRDAIDLHFEGRCGVGLSSLSPLEAELEVETGDELSFSYGQPFFVRRPNELPAVVVTVLDGRKERREGFELEQRLALQESWHEGRIPLQRYAGKRVKVRFELAVQSGVEGLCALADVRVRRRAASPRTVLLVTSDTHRGDHVGSAGLGVDVRTPAIDALAARGVLFEDCYSTTNVTCPSHVALMTGFHPRDTLIVDNMNRLGGEAVTLAEKFQARGFTTYGVVSVRHLSHIGVGLGQGFDRVVCPQGDTWDAEVALEHLERWLPDAEGYPLFVWLHLFDAHYPYEPPDELGNAYYPRGADPFDPRKPPIEGIDAGGTRTELVGLRDLEYPIAQYRGEVTYLDRELARAFEHPRLRGGVIAFTADHGEIFARSGVFFDHTGLYPDTLHVPLVLAWPGSPVGLRVASPVGQLGIGRTLLDLAGLENEPFPGESLLRHVEDEPPDAPRFAISAHGFAACVQYQGWIYLLHLRDHEGPNEESRRKHEDDLYHLVSDPRCLDDRVEAERARAGRMRALLVEWLGGAEDAGVAKAAQSSQVALAQLAALGYAMHVPNPVGDAWIDPQCDCVHCAAYR